MKRSMNLINSFGTSRWTATQRQANSIFFATTRGPRMTGFRNNGLEIEVYYGAIFVLTQPVVGRLTLQWEDLMVTALPVSMFVASNALA
jgi:hypothetical protein